jgi:ABC-type Fe3+ transport system substrate-binding protein
LHAIQHHSTPLPWVNCRIAAWIANIRLARRLIQPRKSSVLATEKLSPEDAMTLRRTRPVPIGIAAVLATLACAQAETLDQLYEKAKPEKTLMLYGAGPSAPYERWIKEFQQRFPGIIVTHTGGFSNVLNDKINQQLKDKKLELDMALFQTVQDFIGWKKQGALLAFKYDGFDQVAPAFRDEDGAFTAVAANPIAYAYNSKLVAPPDVPKSALDFLKPQFSGRLITVYPSDDDAALYLFNTIVEKYGWDYMDKYMAMKPNFIQGHLLVSRSVASGESLATFDATLSTAGGLKRAGQPIEILFSPVDETPVFTVTAGIFKDAPHPNAAKLYLQWYLAMEQQSRIGVFSPRSDVPPPEGLQPLATYKIANRYRYFVSDEARLDALRKRFEGYTGPVVNHGGVR